MVNLPKVGGWLFRRFKDSHKYYSPWIEESFPPVPISGQLSLKTVLSVSSTSSSMEPLSVAIDVGWIPSKNDVKDGWSACSLEVVFGIIFENLLKNL
ncbi:unnamed protein product [Rhizophagus irregularis]|nr:unnamed protein product [Rhizophagus irregularis]